MIHVLCVMHNEERLLPYFLRHYETFADRIVIIDDHSTDRTVELARAHPKVEIQYLVHDRGALNDEATNVFYQHYARTISRGVADWVINIDADEFVYHPAMVEYLQLERERGKRLLCPEGYDMIAETFPTTTGQIYDEVRDGYRRGLYDKPVVFDPTANIVFDRGRHFVKETDVPVRRSQLKLLHFRYLGREHFIEKYTYSFGRRDYSPRKIRRCLKQGLEAFEECYHPRIRVL
jgi:glycosyltransferase involved in cell wall biosynthesis